MKKISFVVAALTILSLSSCYVEEREGHHYHHPFWHHREVVEIRGENNIKPANSHQTPVDMNLAKK